MTPFAFDNTYARLLPDAGVRVQPALAPSPRLLYLNQRLADELGLDLNAQPAARLAEVWSGQALPEGAEPFAQAYAGHQFGGFSPQLGDGRALLLGEVIDRLGQRRDIAFKGSGRTPFSRGGDGKAAVGPMLREALMGEAMHALGVPTTRALAVVATGDTVQRERPLPGAVLTRVAASHLRVGTLQYFAARGDLAMLRRVVAYALERHPSRPALEAPPASPAEADARAAARASELADAGQASDLCVELLSAVASRQARLVAQWMNLGFIHGVMNTDNMTISGETIDYGPCAFIEAYHPEAVFSSIDHGGRYAYSNQPLIARWNLARLAEALLPLMARPDDDEGMQLAVTRVTEVIDAFPAQHAAECLAGWRAKLGLDGDRASEAHDTALAEDFLTLLEAQQVDFTLAWRCLADAAESRPQRLQALMADTRPLTAWMQRWQARRAPDPGRAAGMRRVSPWLIARNHRVEEALAAATAGDLGPFTALLEALERPFDEDDRLRHFAVPAPAAVTAAYQTFCGT